MRELLFAAALAVTISITAASCVHAKSIAVNTSQPGVTILLTDEPCGLQDKVSNLPNRATWHEKGVTHEGCWGLYPGTVIAFFADLTAVAIPAQTFRAATEI